MAENQTQLGKSKSQLHVLLAFWGTVIAPGCVFLTEPLQGMLQTPCSHRELSLLNGCSGTGMVKAHRSSLAGWVVALQTLVGLEHRTPLRHMFWEAQGALC